MKKYASLLFVSLTCWACAKSSSPTEPSPNPTNVVSYTAVGASDAIGYGSSVLCLPFTDCPNGMGYVQVIARRLQAAGNTVTLLNLGIPTAVLSPATESLGASLGRDIYGNFLTQEMPFVAKDSTLVTVFAGGNDVNTVGAALDAGLGGVDNAGYVDAQTQNFGRDMRTLVAGIKARAPQARIVILNLPNMGALPYAAGYTLDRKRWLQTIAVGFSAQINSLTAQGALVIDLMCDATFYQPGIFSGDGFHPNDTGYAHLADVMNAAVTGGTATAPRASCAQMSVF
jgi:lysophospholipase L1-like esterase